MRGPPLVSEMVERSTSISVVNLHKSTGLGSKS